MARSIYATMMTKGCQAQNKYYNEIAFALLP